MKRLTFEELKHRLQEKTSTMVFDVTDARLKGKANFRCLQCNRVATDRNVEHFLLNPICPYCEGNQYDNDKFQEVLEAKYGKRFILKSDYKGMHNKVTVLCTQCKMEETTLAGQLYQYGTCVHCKMFTSSQGEQVIFELLSYNNIEFEYQYSIPNTDTGNWVLFDFYIPKYKVFIEFQGRQHYDTDNGYYSESYHQRDLWKKKYVEYIKEHLVYIDNLNLDEILVSLKTYLGTLQVPEEINRGNFYLPIYQIYKDSRTMPNKDVCTKYGIGSAKLDIIIKLYKDTEYELLQVKSETKYAPVKIQDQKSFEEELKRVSNNRYDVLGSYKDSNTPILVRCHKCNREFTVRPRNIIRPKNLESMGCRYCEGSYAKTKEQTQKLLDYIYPNQYVLPDDYAGVAKKVMIHCNKCGKDSDKKPTQVLTGNGCRCSSKRFGDDTNSSPKVSLEVANKLLLGIK